MGRDVVRDEMLVDDGASAVSYRQAATAEFDEPLVCLIDEILEFSPTFSSIAAINLFLLYCSSEPRNEKPGYSCKDWYSVRNTREIGLSLRVISGLERSICPFHVRNILVPLKIGTTAFVSQGSFCLLLPWVTLFGT
jgi:hypothetical protein